MVESRLIIMCKNQAGNLPDKRSLAVFFFERTDCHDESLKLCDCSDTNGDTEMLPGVTGAMGGHSAWLQVSSSDNKLNCSNL